VSTQWEVNLIPHILKGIFRQVLEREYKPVELLTYGCQLKTGEITVKEIIQEVILSEEYEDSFIEPFSEEIRVKYCFNHLLARDPTQDEIAEWKEISVDEGIDEVITRIMADSELYPYGDDETALQVRIISGLMIYLQASNDLYVCAEHGGGGKLIANRYKPLGWETFIIGKINRENGDINKSDKISLQVSNNQYVCAESGGGKDLIANRNLCKEWETFEIQKVDDELDEIYDGDTIELKAFKGNYVGIDLEDQYLQAIDDEINDRNKFIIHIQYLR
jgi:hypothetical protein